MNDFLCPFCFSMQLVSSVHYADEGEVPAIECRSCNSGAPLSTWERFAPKRDKIEKEPITVEEWNR